MIEGESRVTSSARERVKCENKSRPGAEHPHEGYRHEGSGRKEETDQSCEGGTSREQKGLDVEAKGLVGT